MDKIKNLMFIFFIAFGSCSNNNLDSEYQLYYLYNPWTKVDFTNNNFNIEYGGFKYSDSVIFNKEELKIVMSSFLENKIYQIKGEVMLAKGFINMPPVNFTILTLRNESLVSEITINENYRYNDMWPFGELYRIMRFQNTVLPILRNNKKIERATDSLLKYQSSKWIKHRQ